MQTTVALSSTEAEYLVLSAAVKEALFLRNLVGDVLPSAAKTIVLHEDNQSTIKQALNLTGSERTKHVDIRHHFLNMSPTVMSAWSIYLLLSNPLTLRQ